MWIVSGGLTDCMADCTGWLTVLADCTGGENVRVVDELASCLAVLI